MCFEFLIYQNIKVFYYTIIGLIENITLAIRYYSDERMKASNNNLTNYDYKMESLVFKTFDEAMDFINKIVDETWKKYEIDMNKSTKVLYQNEKYPNFKKFNMFVY